MERKLRINNSNIMMMYANFNQVMWIISVLEVLIANCANAIESVSYLKLPLKSGLLSACYLIKEMSEKLSHFDSLIILVLITDNFKEASVDLKIYEVEEIRNVLGFEYEEQLSLAK